MSDVQVNEAVQEVKELLDELTGEPMTKQQYKEVLEDLKDDIDSRLTAVNSALGINEEDDEDDEDEDEDDEDEE